MLDKLTPQPAVPAGSSPDKKVAAFDVSDRSVSDLSSEKRKLQADLHQEFRNEIQSLRNTFAFPQESQFSPSYKQPPHYEFGPRLSLHAGILTLGPKPLPWIIGPATWS